MRSIHGLALAIFLGLLLLATLFVVDKLDMKSDVLLILAIVAGAVIGVWAVTNADKLIISFTGTLSNQDGKTAKKR